VKVRTAGKNTIRRRLEMLEDLYENNEVLNRTAVHGEKTKKKVPQTCSTADN